jgi:hypothetical protein
MRCWLYSCSCRKVTPRLALRLAILMALAKVAADRCFNAWPYPTGMAAGHHPALAYGDPPQVIAVRDLATITLSREQMTPCGLASRR